METRHMLLFVVIVSIASADDTVGDGYGESVSGTEASSVVVLTNDNFEAVISSKETVLVEFYAPWCGHCKQLAPEYKKAAAILLGNDPPVTLATVDATVEKDLASRFEVSGYPTLKFFRGGKPYEYDGPRTADGIVDYMRVRASKGWRPPAEAVIALTAGNFTDFVDGAELALVEFYAPWCGHCKRLAPVLEKAAQQLRWNAPSIPVAKVDASNEKSLAETYGITGYPTLKVFRNGRVYEYSGPREEQGIVDYMKKQHGDACKPAADSAAIKHTQAIDDVTVIGFFASTESPLYRTYQDAGNDMRENYTMLYTLNEEARRQFELENDCVAVVLPDRLRSSGDEPRIYSLCNANATVSDLHAFYGQHNTPLVGELTQDNAPRRYYKRPMCVLYVNVDWSHEYRDMTQSWRRKLLKVARLHRNDGVTFAIADEDAYTEELKGLGLDDSGSAFSVACIDGEGNKYPMAELDEFDADDVSAFVRAVLAGKAKPYLKSQIAPKQQKGPVTVVVGKTFKSIVIDSAKDVFLELYAPWCGHCKQFEPELKKLAKELQTKEPQLLFAKMDATANDAPAAFAASGYPTIYFVPANNKNKPILYKGNRDLSDLKKFMREHAAISFKSKDEL